jgi:hypothetical protein
MNSSKWSNPARSLFFGNLSYFCSADDLRFLTQPFGISKKCHICRSPNGDSLFYGFVEFEENVNVDYIVQSLHNTLFMGRHIRVSYRDMTANPSPSGGAAVSGSGIAITSTKPTVSLDKGIEILVSFHSLTSPYSPVILLNEELLFQFFSQFGRVLDCVVKNHSRTNNSTTNVNTSTANSSNRRYPGSGIKQGGYGFVLFAEAAAADTALNLFATRKEVELKVMTPAEYDDNIDITSVRISTEGDNGPAYSSAVDSDQKNFRKGNDATHSIDSSINVENTKTGAAMNYSSNHAGEVIYYSNSKSAAANLLVQRTVSVTWQCHLSHASEAAMREKQQQQQRHMRPHVSQQQGELPSAPIRYPHPKTISNGVGGMHPAAALPPNPVHSDSNSIHSNGPYYHSNYVQNPAAYRPAPTVFYCPSSLPGPVPTVGSPSNVTLGTSTAGSGNGPGGVSYGNHFPNLPAMSSAAADVGFPPATQSLPTARCPTISPFQQNDIGTLASSMTTQKEIPHMSSHFSTVSSESPHQLSSSTQYSNTAPSAMQFSYVNHLPPQHPQYVATSAASTPSSVMMISPTYENNTGSHFMFQHGNNLHHNPSSGNLGDNVHGGGYVYAPFPLQLPPHVMQQHQLQLVEHPQSVQVAYMMPSASNAAIPVPTPANPQHFPQYFHPYNNNNNHNNFHNYTS